MSNEESFVKRWPEFFREVNMDHDVDIQDRWKALLWHLCAAIEWELRKAGRPLDHFKIHQIKDKFGRLRFSCSAYGDENEMDRTVRAIYKLVEAAVYKSDRMERVL